MIHGSGEAAFADHALADESIWGLPGVKTAAALTGADAYTTTPLFDHIRAVAARQGDETAFASQSGSLGFAGLLRVARNAAAAVTVRLRPGQPLACLLPRTPHGVAALIGCLMSGRLCMVLDPAHPPRHLAGLLQRAAPAAVLLAEPPPFALDLPVLTLADVVAGAGQDWRPDHAADPDAPCAVYFTSGSSGEPKGIVLSARSILYRALDSAETLALAPGERVFGPSIPNAGSGLSFLLGALTHGARVVLSNIAQEGAGAVLRLVEQEGVTCAVIQPPVMRLLFQSDRGRAAFRGLRTLRVGAAALPRADLLAWRRQLPPDCIVWHTYASTEALILASWVVPPDDAGAEATVASGMIHPNHDYALLDEAGRPVQPGQPGELVLRSRYVALGEWRQGKLVAGRMPPVPGRPGWRYFRTGDVLRVQPDGLLRMLGRADRQVKINGVRVEPGEIEAVLRAEPGVTDAAVVATSGADDVVLKGFVVAPGQDEAALLRALRQRLAASLPNALRPARLTVLERMPTLPSGKIDLMSLSRGT